jgi:glycosyltransferase involved in cell wall biosynthesis
MSKKITVIMASYLGEYKGAARERETKLFRALDSVYCQNYENFEILLMSDGCEKTREIYTRMLLDGRYDSRLKYHEVVRLGTWGGNPRNTGIDIATGEIICYLDIDDYFEPWHLSHIAEHFGDNQFVYFNDFVLNPVSQMPNKPRLTRLAISNCGTSSIAHRKDIKSRWPVIGNYAHDWKFIELLIKECKTRGHIGQGGYCVCHIPNQYDI